jgi:L-ascorbate metabolism protein UlaG (beta-lactamase superfamily)
MMRIVLIALLACVGLFLYRQTALARSPLTFQTPAGELQLTLLGHGSVLLVWQGQHIYVDPYTRAADFTGMPKADQIWITHEHYDHFDSSAINQLQKKETVFIADTRSAAKLAGQVKALANGETAVVGGIEVTAVPAYNVVRERAPGQKYHPKGHGNGYIASFAGYRVYIAGDTEAIPEMSQLQEIDVAVLPVMLPYTMSPAEAVQAAQSFSPKLVLPYHSDASNARQAVELLKQAGIAAEMVLP